MAEKFKLDFVGIGAEKAATSWIAGALSEHPEVYMAEKLRGKEIFFFNDKDPHYLKYKNVKYYWGIGWYERHFSKRLPGKKVGEFSPTYLYGGVAARRIKKHFPDVKIIVSLRNPVKRAFSQYLHDRSIGVIRNILFEDAIAQNRSYIEKGLYHKHLKNYFELFPRENIHVVIFEDIKKNPRKEIRKLYRFLELADAGFIPSMTGKRVFESGEARWSRVNYFLLQSEYWLKRKKMWGLLRTIEGLKLRKAAFVFAHEINRKTLTQYPVMKDETREWLAEEFKEDIGKLEGLLGRDLSEWKKDGIARV